MKNVKIFHGTGETPNSFWLPYVKRSLEDLNYSVLIPQLPDTEAPHRDKWLPVALKQEPYNEHSILISHSIGGQLILSLLERLDTQVSKVIMVAGYARQLAVEKVPNDLMQKEYDWEKIKRNAKEFLFINAINDPWGCNESEGKYLFNHLGGVLILNNEGHMGSDSYKQPYKEFPFLMKLIT